MATVDLAIHAQSEFILLDLRELSDFNGCHIRYSQSFPAPNISRDKFLPDVYRFRNKPGKLIIVYMWDERAGVIAA